MKINIAECVTWADVTCGDKELLSLKINADFFPFFQKYA